MSGLEGDRRRRRSRSRSKRRAKRHSRRKSSNYDEEHTVVGDNNGGGEGTTDDDESKSDADSVKIRASRSRKKRHASQSAERENKQKRGGSKKRFIERVTSRLYGTATGTARFNAGEGGGDEGEDQAEDEELSEEESRRIMQLQRRRASMGNRRRGLAEIRPTILSMSVAKDWDTLEVQLTKLTTKGDPEIDEHNESNGKTALILACEENKTHIINLLLDLGADINARDEEGRTVLHACAQNGNDDLLRQLLAKGADPNIFTSERRQLPLHLAASRASGGYSSSQALLRAMRKECRVARDCRGYLPICYAIESANFALVRDLLCACVEEQILWRDPENGNTLVHLAVIRADVEILKALVLEAHADVDAANIDGQTPLHLASKLGYESMVKTLHTLNANAHLLDKRERTPVHVAAESGNTGIVELLAEKFKANVQMRTKDGSTLMHLASERGHADTVLTFIKRGVPLFMPNRTGTLCLHAAAQNGHAQVVKTLIQKGSPVDARTKDGYTALHLAVLHNQPEVIQTLLGYGAEVDIKGGSSMETPLHIAARLSDGIRCAEMLLKSGANVNNATEETAETPLHIAARYGFIDLMNIMLADGGDPTKLSKFNETCLHLACRYCHYDVVKAIIAFMIHNTSAREATNLINMTNNEAESALHFAAELTAEQIHRDFEHVDIVKLLLDNGAEPFASTRLTQETPLHYCARAGDADILQEFARQLGHNFQAAANRQAKNGWSPLITASEQGHPRIVEVLLQNNARVDVFDEDGKAAIHLAAENGNTECCEVLLKYKAFVNAKSKLGITPLHLAARNGYTDLVKLLIERYGASPDSLSLEERTPLHLAAEAGCKDVCQLLLNLRADANAADSLGQTPLHLAAESDHPEVVKLFMKYKPELMTTANKNGMTCAHIAANKGSVAVIRELMRFNKAIVTAVRNKSNEALPVHLAAAGGHQDVVRVLIDAGASLTDENSEGYTAIHLAAKEGHFEVLECIPSKTMLTTVSVKNGLSPIHVAAFYGKAEIVRELLMRVQPNVKSEAPHHAGSIGDRILKDLIMHDYGLSPLHFASFSGHEGVVRLLLNMPGIQTDEQTVMMACAPMHYASQNGHLTVVSLLLSKSTEHLNIKDKRGRTPLHLAAEHGHSDMVSLLLGQGSEVNDVDKNLWTPLCHAAKAGFQDVVKLLIDSGASPTMKTSEGKTAISLAAAANHIPILSYLLTKEHDTLQLMEDRKFVVDLMICSKTNKNASVEEFVLHSKAPLDTAAKLAKLYRNLALKEKERAKDLNDIGRYCAYMATDLLGMATATTPPSIILRSIDSRGNQFLDSLLEDELKEVVANSAVQRYLSDIWKGDLDWGTGKMFALFTGFLMFPPLWAYFCLPLSHNYHQIPVVKVMAYLSSHIVFLSLITVIAAIPVDGAIAYRTNFYPTWLELVLLLWFSGLLVAELTNQTDRRGLGLLYPINVGTSLIAVVLHIGALIADACYGDQRSAVMLLYFRNQVLSYVLLFGFALILDFFTFHHKFGPFAVIVRDLSIDLSVFLVVLLLFMAGFTMQMSCIFTPVEIDGGGGGNGNSTDTNSTTVAPDNSITNITVDSLVHHEEMLIDGEHNFTTTEQSPFNFSQTSVGLFGNESLVNASNFLFTTIANLAHNSTETVLSRYRRQVLGNFTTTSHTINASRIISSPIEASIEVGVSHDENSTLLTTVLAGITQSLFRNSTTHTSHVSMTTTVTTTTESDLPECEPDKIVHIWVEEDEPVVRHDESFNNLDPWTAVRLFNLLHFAIYSMAEPWLGPYQVKGGPSFSGTLHKVFFGLYMMVVMVVMVNLLIAMMTETYQRIHRRSDSEWKFGRAKLIRDMIKISPTPAPLNLFVRPYLYLRALAKYGKQMFTIYANYYVTEVESIGAEKVLETVGVDPHAASHLDPHGQAGQTAPGALKPDIAAVKLKTTGWWFRQILLCGWICSRNRDSAVGHVAGTRELDESDTVQRTNRGPEPMEGALDWSQVVKRYMQTKSGTVGISSDEKGEGGKTGEEGGETGGGD